MLVISILSRLTLISENHHLGFDVFYISSSFSDHQIMQ